MNSPYFSFTKEPFSRELAPAQAFVSKGYNELLARLNHVISAGSLAVVTGQAGSGKSTAIRSVMYSLDASRYRHIYMASSELSPGEFYKSLLYNLNVCPGRGLSQNKRLVTQAMLEQRQKGIKPTVIIDEAQELPVSMLSELRFEVMEAICKVFDKSRCYPPFKNRHAWFRKVFAEKLSESRGDILTFRARQRYFGS